MDNTSDIKPPVLKPYTCDYEDCSASFVDEERLVIHIRFHTGERPFVCAREGCTKAYTCLANLKRHNKTFHEKRARNNALETQEVEEDVDLEGFELIRRQLSSYQEPEGSKDRAFVCEVEGCNKTYTTINHLKRHHKVIHDQETRQMQKVKCPVDGCSKVLFDVYSLKRHYARKHDPNTPQYAYNCDVCGRGFLRKKQLENHTCSSAGLPFLCSVCGEGFNSLRNCNRHKRTHTVYTCECDMKFERHSHMVAHRTSCDSLRRGFIEKS